MAHNEGLRELALFTGAGGGLLGSQLLGFKTVCGVELDPYCRESLLQRQNDGVLDVFPIWDDIRTFCGYSWRGAVDNGVAHRMERLRAIGNGQVPGVAATAFRVLLERVIQNIS